MTTPAERVRHLIKQGNALAAEIQRVEQQPDAGHRLFLLYCRLDRIVQRATALLDEARA